MKHTRYGLLLFVVAGCAHSNAALLRELEAREKIPALEAAIERGGAAAAAGPLREVTLPMVDGKVPAVLGRLNGVEMPFVLDTGTNHVVATGEAARDAALYVSPRAPEPVYGPGHVSSNRVCTYSTLELGPNRFGIGVATVPERERTGWMRLGTDRYAIVGCSILSHFAVTFDFAKREVRLKPTGLPGYAETLMTTVRVNGKPLWLMVDSGATRVFLEPWAARELDLIPAERAERHEKERGRDLSEALFTRIAMDTVEVHGRVFRDVEGAAVRTFGGLPEAGPRIAGLFGFVGFGDLVWTLDYGTRTFRLHAHHP